MTRAATYSHSHLLNGSYGEPSLGLALALMGYYVDSRIMCTDVCASQSPPLFTGIKWLANST